MNINTEDYSQELMMDEYYDPFYAELEREILILTADSEEGNFCGDRTYSTSPWVAKRNSSKGYLAGKQQESYFCWKEKDQSVNSVPTWILNLWRNENGNGNGNGTGVFIPQIVKSRRRIKPRKKSKEKGLTYQPIANEKR